MPVDPDTSTSNLLQNLQVFVNRYNQQYSLSYVLDYQRFINGRTRLLRRHNGNLGDLLNDPRFSALLYNILIRFGMNARASALVPQQQVLDTLQQVHSEFELLNASQQRLCTINLHGMLGDRTVDAVVTTIYQLFATPGRLTRAGGFVVASKTLHFVMPELFLMLDGQHVAMSLYHISDYVPHPEDGSTWRAVIPRYSGRTPNPSPRGGGRRLWDVERYRIALMYYKRIIREWCQQHNSQIDGFLNLDAGYASTASRIIDKALW